MEMQAGYTFSIIPEFLVKAAPCKSFEQHHHWRYTAIQWLLTHDDFNLFHMTWEYFNTKAGPQFNEEFFLIISVYVKA